MRAVVLQTSIGAALLVLTSFTRSSGSNILYLSPSQTQVTSQRSGDSVAQASRWFDQLKSTDQEKRREAVMELSHVEGGAATTALLSGLTDPSPRVRAAAAAGIAERREAAAIPLLTACLAKDKIAFVRKMAAYALGGYQGADRTAALIAGLTDKDAEVRGAAAVSLGRFSDAAALGPLTAALSDGNAFVRAHAARALGINGSAARQAVPQLSKVLISDEDGEAKRQAATALGLIGDRSALPALERSRHDKDPHLVQAAIESINILKPK